MKRQPRARREINRRRSMQQLPTHRKAEAVYSSNSILEIEEQSREHTHCAVVTSRDRCRALYATGADNQLESLKGSTKTSPARDPRLRGSHHDPVRNRR